MSANRGMHPFFGGNCGSNGFRNSFALGRSFDRRFAGGSFLGYYRTCGYFLFHIRNMVKLTPIFGFVLSQTPGHSGWCQSDIGNPYETE